MDITRSGQQAQDSLNGKLTFEQGNNRIVGRDAESKARLVISAQGDDFSMKVAKEGYDAMTASNDQLVFNSSQNVFKIIATDTYTFTIPASTTGAELITDLQPDVIPIPWVFLSTVAGSTFVPLPQILSSGLSGATMTIGCWCYAQYVEDAGLYIQYVNATASPLGPFTFRWYLLQETAN